MSKRDSIGFSFFSIVTIDYLAYNDTTASYYYTGSDDENHNVCVVGWDDNFEASNFNTPPPGNGAYIVKNCWGTGWGDEGFFYVSYYDTMFTPYAIVVADDPDILSNIYQYDPLGWTWNWGGWGVSEGWGANIFTAAGNENLEAVSFYCADMYTEAMIYIYRNVSGTTDPTNGGLVHTQGESFDFPGYFTVDLEYTIPLLAGEKFSVVVHFDTPSEEYPIPIEYPWPSYSSAASANHGESFVSDNGITWYDLGQGEDSNVCLKAFTNPGTPEISVRFNQILFPDGSSKNLGTKPMGAVVGKEFTFTIDNYGNMPLNLTGSPDLVTVSGPDAKYFMVSEQPTSPVAAGSDTTFKLKTVRDTLPPLPAGFEKTFTFDVNIPNDDSDENPYNFTITVTLKKTS